VSCPTGHILQNVTKDLQKCQKCKEGYYIADSKYCSSTFDCSLATCTKCPKLPARCPGGGPPIFDSKAVTFSVYLHVDVWILSRYHFFKVDMYVYDLYKYRKSTQTKEGVVRNNERHRACAVSNTYTEYYRLDQG